MAGSVGKGAAGLFMKGTNMEYKLSPNPIFWSHQGEAHLRGFGMVFLRLAGCSVGCADCDTDYSCGERVETGELVRRVVAAFPKCRDKWVWLTGGEPADQNLRPLIGALSKAGLSVAVATSGKHRIIPPVAWISVSYHGGYPLSQAYGNEIKLVPGLNGIDPWQFLEEYPDDQTDFFYRYVQPMWDNEKGCEDAESLKACIAFVKDNPNWSLSRQDHKVWGLK